MRRIRTTPILVIAILHLTGGSIDLLSSLCSCGSLLMLDSFSSFTPAPPTFPTRPGQPASPQLPPNAIKYLNENVPGYRAFTIVGLGLSFLLDIMLLSAGIGLLKMQPWARWLSLVYAPISIVFRVGGIVYQFFWVMPATQALYASFPATAGFSSLMTISLGIGVFAGLLIVIYPISVIIVLLLPSTSAAFRGEISIRDDDWRADEPEA